MMENENNKFMRRCLDLAVMAEGLTYPNPMVGACVVHEGRIIGEGYHLIAGGPHAEVIAINAVTDKEMLKASTLYVNLEPCSHFGKTPPCADFIIAHSIPRVVAGTQDPSEKVSGQGLARLRKAGCEVIAGVCEEECIRLNRRFFTFHKKRRPYITLKWAQSADGFIDILRMENSASIPNWITGKPERALVHRWRAEEHSILVGAGTVRADDPKLNVRDWKGKDPVRIILSSSGIIDKNSAMLRQAGETLMFTDNVDEDIPGVFKVMLDKKDEACRQIVQYLFNSGIQSLLIEGGAGVLEHFISCGLWDEARIFTGRGIFEKGVSAPFLRGELFSRTEFSSSVLEIYLNSDG